MLDLDLRVVGVRAAVAEVDPRRARLGPGVLRQDRRLLDLLGERVAVVRAALECASAHDQAAAQRDRNAHFRSELVRGPGLAQRLADRAGQRRQTRLDCALQPAHDRALAPDHTAHLLERARVRAAPCLEPQVRPFLGVGLLECDALVTGELQQAILLHPNIPYVQGPVAPASLTTDSIEMIRLIPGTT